MQSDFAEGAIRIALEDAWQDKGLPGPPKGLFILGLGKLGGNDLNFSSDIDLIAYYDPETFPVSKAKGQAYVAGQVMKRLTRTLMPPNSPDFVYRVDWRLRPEASVSGLAMSTTRASDFYFFRALPWHRLAMLKARVVAGDLDCGRHFLDGLSPFIWRQNLDFRAIDELAALKRRINLEHPRLKAERRASVPVADEPFGFNVKLGSGGIREIEFMANAQQMVWGGKHYGLRTTNTLMALQNLCAKELIGDADSHALDEAYRSHRRLENALQMMRNGHDHVLPAGRDGWSDIAALMGRNTDELMDRTTAHRREVHPRFEAMFAADPLPDAAAPLPSLEPASQTIVDDWTNGFRRYNVRASKRTRLEPLGAALSRRVAATDNPDQAIRRVDAFLGQLRRSEQYLTLLATNPALLDALVDPLLHSPHMSVLLEQSPHIIDGFLDPSPADPGFILADTDYETRLERLRRFVNEGLFQTYHAFLNGTTDWRDMATALTRQAEVTIDTALTIARDDLNAPDLSIAVLALGKLGQGLMAPQSDLDLVFLFEDDVDRDLAAKAVRRLGTILTTPLREGIAYELDTRLRPSGRSGPPAVTLSAFRTHHERTARTWEHIALVPARIVAGDKGLGSAVESELRHILERPRDADQLLADAHAMWAKIAEERIHRVNIDRFDTKLRDGGLMMADFWTSVRSLRGETVDRNLQERWTELLYWERLLGLTGAPVASLPERYSETAPLDVPSIHAELEVRTRALMEGLDADSGLETMKPVCWT